MLDLKTIKEAKLYTRIGVKNHLEYEYARTSNQVLRKSPEPAKNASSCHQSTDTNRAKI